MSEDLTDIADLLILRSIERSSNDRFAAMRRLIASPAMTAADKESLAGELLIDPDPQIVCFASLALRMPGLKQEATLTALRQASRTQPDKHARWAIVNSRAKRGDATVLDECLPLLEPDHEDFDHALSALAKLKTAEALDVLRGAFARFPAGGRKDSIAAWGATAFTPTPAEFVEHLEQRLKELSDKPCQRWTSTESHIVVVLVRQGNPTAIARFHELIALWRAEPENPQLKIFVRVGINHRTPRDDEGLLAAVEEWLDTHSR